MKPTPRARDFYRYYFADYEDFRAGAESDAGAYDQRSDLIAQTARYGMYDLVSVAMRVAAPVKWSMITSALAWKIVRPKNSEKV
jgi:hypothetical protein